MSHKHQLAIDLFGGQKTDYTTIGHLLEQTWFIWIMLQKLIRNARSPNSGVGLKNWSENSASLTALWLSIAVREKKRDEQTAIPTYSAQILAYFINTRLMSQLERTQGMVCFLLQQKGKERSYEGSCRQYRSRQLKFAHEQHAATYALQKVRQLQQTL